ncbi:MAG: hypothetical protein KAX39_01055 [candidate division Zixibacteria bacterium]|nr:hypothetical protein [candidate division Zixibacteria bacterium]
MDKRSKNLAADRQLQSSVNLCECGVVHLNYFNTTIRFTPKNFLNFALMVNEAYYRLKNTPSGMVEDNQTETEGSNL